MEMFDRDLQAMQMGAANIESNEFIVTVLNRFGLLEYWTKYAYSLSLYIYIGLQY